MKSYANSQHSHPKQLSQYAMCDVRCEMMMMIMMMRGVWQRALWGPKWATNGSLLIKGLGKPTKQMYKDAMFGLRLASVQGSLKARAMQLCELCSDNGGSWTLWPFAQAQVAPAIVQVEPVS